MSKLRSDLVGDDYLGWAAACKNDRQYIGFTATAPDPGVTGPYGVTGAPSVSGMSGSPPPTEEHPSAESTILPPCARPYETLYEASVLVGKVVATANYFEKNRSVFQQASVLQVVSVAEYPLAKLLIGLGQGVLVDATAIFRDFRYLDGSICGITTETFEPDL